MLLDRGAVTEDAGALEDNIDAQLAPGKVGGVALGHVLDLLAVDDEVAVAGRDLALEGAVGRIILQQVGHNIDIGQVVDSNELDLGVFDSNSEHIASDTAETVDTNLDTHLCSLLILGSFQYFIRLKCPETDQTAPKLHTFSKARVKGI
jgi:hypothetical protein